MRSIDGGGETQEGARLELKCCCLPFRPQIRKLMLQIISLHILGGGDNQDDHDDQL